MQTPFASGKPSALSPDIDCVKMHKKLLKFQITVYTMLKLIMMISIFKMLKLLDFVKVTKNLNKIKIKISPFLIMQKKYQNLES